MAGTNKVLKDGQILFRAGDKSDGMYIIRRGELRVYLEKDGKEVILASVGEGGMIGEMALFDNQPRSASVKASKECEVTIISQDDFAKLMKQIPKWFVGLMSALSSRLRQTNERLKTLEGATNAPAAAAAPVKPLRPYQAVIRQLSVIALLFHKDGQKEGKDFILSKAAVETALVEVFNENAEKLRDLLSVLVKNKVFNLRQDAYKNPVLALANRGSITTLLNFVTAFAKANPDKPFLSDAAVQLLLVFERIVLASPYDASTVALSDIVKEGKRDGKDTTEWEKAIATLTKAGDEVKVVKTSTGPGLKGQKKDVGTFVQHCQVLAALHNAKLA